jgi:hypothetical protein
MSSLVAASHAYLAAASRGSSPSARNSDVAVKAVLYEDSPTSLVGPRLPISAYGC